MVETGELDERRPDPDRERALAFGTEFRLGTLEAVSQVRKLHKYVALGIILGSVVLVVGIPVAIGISGGPYPAAGKVVTDVIVGGLFAACCALFGAGRARTETTTRLYRYSEGLAQLVGDEPEPLVARWADVQDFSVDYYEPEDMPPRLNGFRLTTRSGTRLPGISGQVHRREVRAVVAEAERHLAPRLVPAMTEAYESGQTVSFGRAEVSREGVVLLPGWRRPGELVPWPEVKSIHMTYVDRRHGDYVNEIIIGRKGKPAEAIRVEFLTNGIFLPALLSHAARQQGVMVTGYHADGGGITG
jgi:hypothetical protein